MAAYAASLLALASGCSVYDPNLLGNAVGPGDLPQRPDASTSSSADDQTLVFAFHSILLDQNSGTNVGAWETIGLDLDGLNTTATDPTRECSNTGATQPIDGEDGIDNVLGGQLWSVILTSQALKPLSCEIDLSFRAGHGTLLLKIENYNGQPDDAQVVATLAPAVDGTAGTVDPAMLTWNGFDLMLGAGEAPEPVWEGDPAPSPNLFFVNPRAFYPSGDAKVSDLTAYVVDNTLVLELTPTAADSFELLTENRSVPIVLSEGYIIAEMDDAHENIPRGILAGRYPLVDLRNVGESIGVCDADQFADLYALMGDLRATPRGPDEPPDPSTPCSALSMGVQFEGVKAVWAGMAEAEQPAPVWCENMVAPPAECL